jgi:hypothetical protein
MDPQVCTLTQGQEKQEQQVQGKQQQQGEGQGKQEQGQQLVTNVLTPLNTMQGGSAQQQSDKSLRNHHHHHTTTTPPLPLTLAAHTHSFCWTTYRGCSGCARILIISWCWYNARTSSKIPIVICLRLSKSTPAAQQHSNTAAQQHSSTATQQHSISM